MLRWRLLVGIGGELARRVAALLPQPAPPRAARSFLQLLVARAAQEHLLVVLVQHQSERSVVAQEEGDPFAALCRVETEHDAARAVHVEQAVAAALEAELVVELE